MAVKPWRAKMNAALGAAAEAARQGNMEAAANYHAAAMARAENRGTAQTVANVAAQAPKAPSPPQPGPAYVPEQIQPHTVSIPSGGGQSSPTTSNPSPPPARPPDPWIRSSNYVAPTGIKQADPDIVLFDSAGVSPELIFQLEYENLSGMELINISRSDIIDGQDVIYSPIKNLSSIRRRYNPNNIISLPELSSSFFSRFAIDLIQRGMNDPYFDDEGNLVIEIDNVRDDEVIEVEIDTNGTIEEVEFL